jgi:bidirectional [NiFe] hydrogenase diaphorase subunit
LFDGTEIKARAGANLLWTALDNGFYIPNLCSIRDIPKPFASCRLCFVEIVGRTGPVTACTESTVDGMAVTLQSPRIRRLRKSSFDLLISNHRLACSSCCKNLHCDLQKIAVKERFKLIDEHLRKIDFDLPVDLSHPMFALDRNKCVLCGKCIWACHQRGLGALEFAHRGIKTIVSTFADLPLSESQCNSCMECVAVCPVGALYPK